MTSGGNLLIYSLYTDAARTRIWGDGSLTTGTITGTGTGAPESRTIYGRIVSGQIGLVAGSYTDTTSVTVSY
jgi:spore coat protein U-like protein